MADEYKKIIEATCGIGGTKCECCNDYFGKDKPILNRIARRKFKRNLLKDFKINGIKE